MQFGKYEKYKNGGPENRFSWVRFVELLVVILKTFLIMEYLSSPRGNKQLLVLDGHIYSAQKKLAGNVIL